MGRASSGDDLRRVASTCTATVRRETFEASERRGKTELHRIKQSKPPRTVSFGKRGVKWIAYYSIVVIDHGGRAIIFRGTRVDTNGVLVQCVCKATCVKFGPDAKHLAVGSLDETSSYSVCLGRRSKRVLNDMTCSQRLNPSTIIAGPPATDPPDHRRPPFSLTDPPAKADDHRWPPTSTPEKSQIEQKCRLRLERYGNVNFVDERHRHRYKVCVWPILLNFFFSIKSDSY
ncbi:hypothetical protein Dimus_031406 [Dionaea muscipula]